MRWFSFSIANFPFIFGNIHLAFSWSFLITTCRKFCPYLQQGPATGLCCSKSSLQKLYGCHHEPIDRYGVSISTMRTEWVTMSYFNFPSLFYPGRDILWGPLRVFLEKQWTLSQFIVESRLLIYLYVFVSDLFHVPCKSCLFPLSSRHHWIMFFIVVRILVLLIPLSYFLIGKPSF